MYDQWSYCVHGLYQDWWKHMIFAQISTAFRGGSTVYSIPARIIMYNVNIVRMEIDGNNTLSSGYNTTWSWDKCCLCQHDGIEPL